jgi:hypothetical protein
MTGDAGAGQFAKAGVDTVHHLVVVNNVLNGGL